MNFAVIFFGAVYAFLGLNTTWARWRRYQEGNFVIGALFPVTNGSDCSTVQKEGLALVEAFVYAVEKINANSSGLSDVTLGYDIRDSCSSNAVALKELLNILGAKQDSAQKSCSLSRKATHCGVIAVVGPDSSHGAMVTSGVLSAYGIPQVSYGATNPLLNNKSIYRSFFRTCPSDSQFAASLASIVAFFGWSCINIVSSRDNSDATTTELLKQRLKNHDICVELDEKARDENIPRIVSEIKSRSRISVTVLFGKEGFVLKLLKEARKQNLTKKVWIGGESWSTELRLVEGYSDVSAGMMWLSAPKENLGEFDFYVERLRKNVSNAYCAWLEKGSRWPVLCQQSDKENVDSISPNSLSLVKVPYVINAVLAVAHGLRQLMKCVIGQANVANCLMRNFTLQQVRERLFFKVANSSFSSFENVTKTFNSNGELKAEYDVVVSHKIHNENWMPVNIGKWTNEKGLVLSKKDIRWPGNEHQVPYSGCSDRCPLGTVTKYGVVTCRRGCHKCPYGTYNDNRSATHCKVCLKDQMPSEHQSACIEKPLAVVDPYHWPAILFLVVCGLGETLTLFVIGVLVKYQNTPVVKATNLTFTVLTLIALLAWFLMPALYIGKPTDLTCKLRTVSFCVLYTTVTSVLLTKTNRLIRIFSAFKKTCFLSNCWYGFLTCALVLVQCIMSVVYLIFFPPKVAYDFGLDTAVIVECNEHMALDLATLAYNMLVSVMCGYLAFKSRELPRAYNEGKWICLATFTNFLSWVAILICRHASPVGKVNIILTILALIAGAYLMLALLFLPKLRVIFFRPEKNTKLAAIESTRRYSLEQASGLDLSPVQGGRPLQGSSLRRHTSPACLALQFVNGSSVKLAAPKGNLGPRRSLIGTIKESPEERKDENK